MAHLPPSVFILFLLLSLKYAREGVLINPIKVWINKYNTMLKVYYISMKTAKEETESHYE